MIETVEEFKARISKEHGTKQRTTEEMLTGRKQEPQQGRRWCGACEQDACNHQR